MTGDGHLLPPEWLPRLERLSLDAKRRVAGTLQGKRRSRRLGSSLEFADYRVYSPGDDVRRFDWGVYSRTGKAFVRQFMDEQELTVSIFVDCSASMGTVMSSAADSPATTVPSGMKGSPKWTLARQLAASIGYMALSSYDRLQIACYSRTINNRLPIMRGKGSAHRLFSFLQGAETGGEGSLSAALAVPGALPRQPGMTWVFSDFWLEGGEEELFRALSLLSGTGQEVVLVHVLSREELEPKLAGDLRLVDSETMSGKEVALTGKVLDAYKEELERYRMMLSSVCAERGMSYVLIPADMPLTEAMFGVLAGAGLVTG
ncbi:DUF58 domain-containing protein [Paenibacillus glucanolyticus]|uniref:DUF58 domain-containing protein n=1 Tax=Paenibacillus glucanolyticus TaxID=59843 RepID=A0A163FV81_9BACL|nr:DUF58 domain-containing protein [Paenibacillus glucanolyticus]KZS44574.1 hypothetical protein AWU65_31480 [Paenibacillus glucanolyticus]